MRMLLKQSKQGVASLYVVIFATILFGVITLSFIRITVSELSQTNDSDLSQSAYDAALAGVEDAKLAANKYYNCVNSSGGNADSCVNIFKQDCGFLGEYLYEIEGGGEVEIQESVDVDETNNANQAYTCVILDNETPDYRGTLDSSTRVQVIPIETYGKAKDIATIRVSWYSRNNGINFNNIDESGLFAKRDQATIPPVLAAALISVGQTFNFETVSKVDESTRDGSYFTTTVLLPSSSKSDNVEFYESKTFAEVEAENVYGIESEKLKNAADAKSENSPFMIVCVEPGQKREFACQVDLDITGLTVEDGNFYLVLSMPYGAVETDYKIEKESIAGKALSFKDVQVSVDSTGRASDLYRRVETRLSPADSAYPFPQFELELANPDDKGNSALEKSFWVTKKCWPTNNCNNNGTIE